MAIDKKLQDECQQEFEAELDKYMDAWEGSLRDHFKLPAKAAAGKDKPDEPPVEKI